MVKLNKAGRPKRARLQVTVDKDTLAWVDSILGSSKPLCDTSHAVEWALLKLKEKIEKGQK